MTVFEISFIHRRTDGRTDGQIDGQIDGQTDGQTDGHFSYGKHVTVRGLNLPYRFLYLWTEFTALKMRLDLPEKI